MQDLHLHSGRDGWDATARETLLDGLEDAGLREFVVEGLGETSDERVLPVVRQLSLLAPSAAVRDAAADAMRVLCVALEREPDVSVDCVAAEDESSMPSRSGVEL